MRIRLRGLSRSRVFWSRFWVRSGVENQWRPGLASDGASKLVDSPKQNSALARWSKEKTSLKGWIDYELACHGGNYVWELVRGAIWWKWRFLNRVRRNTGLNDQLGLTITRKVLRWGNALHPVTPQPKKSLNASVGVSNTTTKVTQNNACYSFLVSCDLDHIVIPSSPCMSETGACITWRNDHSGIQAEPWTF